MSEPNWDHYLDEVREEGRQDGEGAATWLFDGNTSQETFERFRKGLDEGDPEIQLPTPDLSGEWADGKTTESLRKEFFPEESVTVEWIDEEIATAYEEGFNEGVETEVSRVIGEHLDG